MQTWGEKARRLKVAGLFAGIGGFEAGFARAGHDCVFHCEIAPPAIVVLAARCPGVALHSDVETLASLPGEVEAILAGFPCQDLSQAGRTAGIAGRRSSLVNHVFRLLDARPVPWVVLENVPFMLQLDGGRAMDLLVGAFEERGYRWAYRVVDALAFLPQRRRRVFFVATRAAADPADVLFVDDAEPTARPTALDTHAHGFYWTEGVRGLGWVPDAIPTLKTGSALGIPSPPAIVLPSGGLVTPDIRDAERLQGFPADWTRPAASADRSSGRWSLVGNAVSVPVAAWIGERLAAPGRYDLARDRDLTAQPRWPNAARWDGKRRRGVAIGAFPHWRARAALADFLAHAGKPLSQRATRGFLGRIERSRLRFVPGFAERVRAHLGRMTAEAAGGACGEADGPA